MYCHRQNKISQSIITVTAVGRYTPGDKLQEQVAGTRRNTSQQQITSWLENFCENKCVSAKEFCCSNICCKKRKSDRIYVTCCGTKYCCSRQIIILTKILQYKRSDLLLWCVAATSRLTWTHRVIRSCNLYRCSVVCSDLIKQSN